MDLAARKYHLIEELLKVENESVMAKLEKILAVTKTPPHHKEILEKRMEEYAEHPSDLIDWNNIKENW